MKYIIVFITLVGLGFCFTAVSHAKKINIHTDNLSDLSALRAKNTANNLSAATNLFALTNHLGNIHFEYMTTKRSLDFMDKGDNICVINKIKTKQRMEKYLFSRPINIFLSRRLYQNISYPALVLEKSDDDSVLLSELFTNRAESKVIISKQISYGDTIDAQLALLAERNIITRHSSEHDTGVMAMFVKGRGEFALLYPHQVYDSSFTIDARSYAISGASPYILGHLMCTNSLASIALIAKVDKYLSDPENLTTLLNIHLNNVNPIDKPAIERYFNQSFVNSEK